MDYPHYKIETKAWSLRNKEKKKLNVPFRTPNPVCFPPNNGSLGSHTPKNLPP